MFKKKTFNLRKGEKEKHEETMIKLLELYERNEILEAVFDYFNQSLQEKFTERLNL